MTHPTSPHLGQQPRKARIIGRFARDEGGALIIFTLMLFVLMVMMGGMAVDLMRYEATRTALQQVSDRSVLAAAALSQDLDREGVVEDYFDKEGFSAYLVDVSSDEGLNFANVAVTAEVPLQPFFMHMLGIDNLNAPAASAAEQRITNVEIAMVLDVSRSMVVTPSRIVNLKSAAREFVRTVRGNDPENRISISLVPYNGQVNLGQTLREKYNETHVHGMTDVNCLDLPTNTFSAPGLSRSTALAMTPHADAYSSSDNTNGFVSFTSTDYAIPNPLNRWCPPMPDNIVRVHQNNVETLEAQIEALDAIGATSIDLGMKWGAVMLDPGTRGIVTEMVNAGQVPAVFAGRPFDYTDREAMKVIVLMTDGENFDETRIRDAYRTGDSTIWRGNSDNNYSAFHASRVSTNTSTAICNSRPFYVPHRNQWHSRPWNGTVPSSTACYSQTATYTGVTRQTWQQLWSNQRVSWVAWQLYARALGGTNSGNRNTQYNTWMNNFREVIDSTDMDDRLQDICNSVKANNVIVFGIAFEATSHGINTVRNCATSNSHFFDADGLEIATAFRAIASQISTLRLTQ
ncbi:VWA domain-containing protein [Fertoebacter nigrum]|uniref:VWA domain-containing protein n=1 Tax=Fertoeibacter niger TaxID=2656921 RepID=A0A8X8H242_9RHOB|nr:TadE/TadG family type IV pilus assembly protein [Fertoeibacter niger]NUB44153.1 VWA domain-containing protein [Fertoeibacter niger]